MRPAWESEIVVRARRLRSAPLLETPFVACGAARRLCLVLAVVLIAAFCALTASVATGAAWVGLFDERVMLFFSSIYNEDALSLVSGITWFADAEATITIALVLLIVLVAKRRYRWALVEVISMGGGEALSFGVKYAIGRARPDDPHIALPGDPSFPSGHTFSAVLVIGLVVLFICLLVKARGTRAVAAVLLVCWVALIGFTRLFLGVHWPSDVLGGYLLGFAWIDLTAAVLLKLPLRGALP